MMSKVFFNFIFIAAALNVSAALKCIEYGKQNNPTDVTMPKVADLKVCVKDNPVVDARKDYTGLVPCTITCSSSATHCFNQYYKGQAVFGGCVNSGGACPAGASTVNSGMNQGAIEFCCSTDNCNTNAKPTLKVNNARGYEAPLAALIASLALLGSSF